MYCDMPPQSAFNFAAYNQHSLPPTPPHTEEETAAAAVAAAAAASIPASASIAAPSKRPAAATTVATAVNATVVVPDRHRQAPQAHPEPCKRPRRETAPSPDIDIVNVVRSSSPDVLKPRQEKIWRPYGAADE